MAIKLLLVFTGNPCSWESTPIFIVSYPVFISLAYSPYYCSDIFHFALIFKTVSLRSLGV